MYVIDLESRKLKYYTENAVQPLRQSYIVHIYLEIGFLPLDVVLTSIQVLFQNFQQVYLLHSL